MGSFQLEIAVQRPRDVVFDYLADVRNTPAWYSAVKSAHQLQGDGPALGATYAIVRDLPQGRAEDTVTVTAFAPPSLFEFGTDEGPTPFSYRYMLEGDGGTTTIHLDGRIELSGPARMLGPIATRAFRRGMEQNLATLRSVIEAR